MLIHICSSGLRKTLSHAYCHMLTVTCLLSHAYRQMSVSAKHDANIVRLTTSVCTFCVHFDLSLGDAAGATCSDLSLMYGLAQHTRRPGAFPLSPCQRSFPGRLGQAPDQLLLSLKSCTLVVKSSPGASRLILPSLL